jgi:alpha-L-fucosidase
MSEVKPFPWLTDDSVDWKTWCHVETADYKSTKRLIEFLVDVVSKNGCVLLNVTPTADGEIPEPVRERLLEMGQWLELNGEAIYESRPWTVSGEGSMEIVEGHLSEEQNAEATSEEIRFTQRDGYLYAIALDWPDDGSMLVRTLSSECPHLGSIESIVLLGHDGELTWKQDESGLQVALPEERPCPYAPVLRLRANAI